MKINVLVIPDDTPTPEQRAEVADVVRRAYITGLEDAFEVAIAVWERGVAEMSTTPPELQSVLDGISLLTRVAKRD